MICSTSLPEWSAAAMEAPLRALVEELGLKPIQLFTAIRVAVTGRTVSPPLFETMEALGSFNYTRAIEQCDRASTRSAR